MDFSNARLGSTIVGGMVKNDGEGWAFANDVKGSNTKSTLGYLFQELTSKYDESPEDSKVLIPLFKSTGFYYNKEDDTRRFIIDQKTQLDLKTMKWDTHTQQGEGLVLVEPKCDEIEFHMK